MKDIVSTRVIIPSFFTNCPRLLLFSRSSISELFKDRRIEIGEYELDEMCVMVYTLTMMNADKDPTDIPEESN